MSIYYVYRVSSALNLTMFMGFRGAPCISGKLAKTRRAPNGERTSYMIIYSRAVPGRVRLLFGNPVTTRRPATRFPPQIGRGISVKRRSTGCAMCILLWSNYWSNWTRLLGPCHFESVNRMSRQGERSVKIWLNIIFWKMTLHFKYLLRFQHTIFV